MMSYDDAIELIERMPFIRTFNVNDNRVLEELVDKASHTEDYVEWIKVIKTCYVREHFVKKKPLSQKIKVENERIKRQLESMFCEALNIPYEEVEGFIKNYIDEND